MASKTSAPANIYTAILGIAAIAGIAALVFVLQHTSSIGFQLF
jgi:hypothetical protein